MGAYRKGQCIVPAPLENEANYDFKVEIKLWQILIFENTF